MKLVVYILAGLLGGCVVINIDDAPPCSKKRIELFGYIVYESCDSGGVDTEYNGTGSHDDEAENQ